jgi:hypothetical protein
MWHLTDPAARILFDSLWVPTLVVGPFSQLPIATLGWGMWAVRVGRWVVPVLRASCASPPWAAFCTVAHLSPPRAWCCLALAWGAALGAGVLIVLHAEPIIHIIHITARPTCPPWHCACGGSGVPGTGSSCGCSTQPSPSSPSCLIMSRTVSVCGGLLPPVQCRRALVSLRLMPAAATDMPVVGPECQRAPP